MSVQLNHTIVVVRDRRESAEFLAEILGLSVGTPTGPFLPVATGNGVTLDFATSDEPTIPTQHYAFLVSEPEFDVIFDRIRRADIDYWADPARRHPGETYHHNGSRGVYFSDPSGHFLEILTGA
jgi:catechol 2,3-dioxygenase-like lactoylglutathione lyase family enzyme